MQLRFADSELRGTCAYSFSIVNVTKFANIGCDKLGEGDFYQLRLAALNFLYVLPAFPKRFQLAFI